MTFEKINSKVVRATIAAQSPALARRGAMLGYDGTVAFRPLSATQGGAGGVLGMAAGESVPMMAAEGQGTVLYGYRGLYVTVINLNGESLSVEADRLLAHDANLQTSLEMIAQGGISAAVRGMATGQGLFTTKISGHGSVAVLSHGGTIALSVTGGSLGVDPQAYVGHVGNLNVDLKAKVGWRDAVGRGSGEAFQLQVSGHGTVYVQASEKKF
jgi:uncharacterized protein (AIM24 family)